MYNWEVISVLTDIKTKCDQAKLYVFFVCYTGIKNITSRKTIIVFKCMSKRKKWIFTECCCFKVNSARQTFCTADQFCTIQCWHVNSFFYDTRLFFLTGLSWGFLTRWPLKGLYEAEEGWARPPDYHPPIRSAVDRRTVFCLFMFFLPQKHIWRPRFSASVIFAVFVATASAFHVQPLNGHPFKCMLTVARVA